MSAACVCPKLRVWWATPNREPMPQTQQKQIRRISISDSRSAALEALLLTDRGIAVQAALDTVFSKCDLGVSDRSLASELAYGVLRTGLTLDARLGEVLPKLNKLPVVVRHVLEIGLYSLLYAERVPAHAAINTAVALAKKRSGLRMGNLVNAVLRKLQEVPESTKSDNVWQNLAHEYALPAEILRLWRTHYGNAASLSLLRRSFARPWPAVRINAAYAKAACLRKAFADEPFGKSIGSWGFAFPPGRVPIKVAGRSIFEWREQGALSQQAAGSQLVMEKLGLFSLKDSFWDCCAGVGGKSMVLLERGAKVALCSDTSGKRLEQLVRDCRRLGLVCPKVLQADAAHYTPEDFCGHILVDAPCSSLGVLARRPDVKKRDFSPASLQYFVDTQRAILDNVAFCLSVGYCLAYMTCTLNPAENELQIRDFLAKHPNFILLSQWQSPHSHPWLEGMFGALLQKTA